MDAKDVLLSSWSALTESFGLSQGEASALVLANPQLLYAGEWDAKLGLLCGELAMGPEELVTFAREGGMALLGLPAKEWGRKAEFATAMMGKNREEVAAAAAALLRADFATVILPRHEFLRARGADGPPVPLKDLLEGTDLEWCERMGSTLSEYTSFRAEPKALRGFTVLLGWYDS